MKIAIYHNLPPGGGKRTVYEQIKYLSQKHDLDLYELSSTDEEYLNVRPFCKNVYTFTFKLPKNVHGIKRLIKDFNNFFTLNLQHKIIAKQINESDYDVCLVHPSAYTQAPFILRYLKKPTLYFCEEYLRIVYEKELEFTEKVGFHKKIYEMVTRLIRKKIDRDNARSADLVVANSKFTQKNIQKAYKIKAEYCHLGVDTKIFKKTTKKRGNYVLVVGDKDEAGGFDFANKIIKNIPAKIRPQIKRLGFSKGKLMLNNDKKVAKEYSHAIATLCISYNEPFGLASIESQACQTPVFAVDEGGFKETVISGKTGYLLKRDPKLFANKLIQLIKHPKKQESLGKKGKKSVVDNFAWEKHCKKIEKHLTRLSNK
jgi:glycosyltransferase involved in cell wall biosynthesis